jgi:anti-anti-sigma factor
VTEAAPHFEIRCEPGPQDGAQTLAVSGELDSASCQALSEALERALSDTGLTQLRLDLQGTTFVDSAGTRTLILLERRAGERGVDLEVVPAPAEVTALLRLAGFSQRVYPSESGAQASADEEFLERIDIELAREPTAPAQARTEVRQGLGARVDEAELATLVLLTSELTTNAVIHPRDSQDQRLGLRITVYPQRVRVEVDDPGTGFDPSSLVGPTDSGGRGLMLVDRAASRWGVGPAGTPRGGRFTVWFERDHGSPDAQSPGR